MADNEPRKNTFTRRNVLKLGGIGVLLGGASYAGYRINAVPLDVTGLSIFPNAEQYLFSLSPEDWAYNHDHILEYFSPETDPIQAANPTVGVVSTPEDGVAAGFTADGRLNNLLFPHTTFTHHVPYYTNDRSEPLHGAKPWEGGFLGVRIGGEVEWCWDDAAFTQTVEHAPGLNGLEFTYTGKNLPVNVTEQVYVMPGTGTVVRDATVTNTGDSAAEGELFSWLQANVNDNQQTFLGFDTNRNWAAADDTGIYWRDMDGPYSLRMYTSKEIGVRSVANTGPTGVNAADDVFAHVLEKDGDAVAGRYLTGSLGVPFDLPPDAETDIPIFLHGGSTSFPLPLQRGTEKQDRQTRVHRFWDQYREQRQDFHTNGAGLEELYRDAVDAMAAAYDPETGSIPAAPNLIPTYWPSWPRDGAFTSMALARAGHEAEAKHFLGGFLPAVQETDGSFVQCYTGQANNPVTDGRESGEAGIIDVEYDQQPLYVLAVADVYEQTGDDTFLREAWPAARNALTFTEQARGHDGLLVGGFDIREEPDDIEQSLYANVIAYEAFRRAAQLDPWKNNQYKFQRVAQELGDAVEQQFFDGSGYTTIDGFWGERKELTGFTAAAAWPSTWAEEYGYTDMLLDDLLQEYKEEKTGRWVFGDTLLAAALTSHDRENAGETVLRDLAAYRLPGGYLPEKTTGDGEPVYGSPLLLPQAGAVITMHQL